MTLKELRALDHNIFVIFEEDLCRVVVEGNARYLLTNSYEYAGSKPSQMYGYRYSWWLCDKRLSDSKRLYRDLIPAKRRPL